MPVKMNRHEYAVRHLNSTFENPTREDAKAVYRSAAYAVGQFCYHEEGMLFTRVNQAVGGIEWRGGYQPVIDVIKCVFNKIEECEAERQMESRHEDPFSPPCPCKGCYR